MPRTPPTTTSGELGGAYRSMHANAQEWFLRYRSALQTGTQLLSVNAWAKRLQTMQHGVGSRICSFHCIINLDGSTHICANEIHFNMYVYISIYIMCTTSYQASKNAPTHSMISWLTIRPGFRRHHGWANAARSIMLPTVHHGCSDKSSHRHGRMRSLAMLAIEIYFEPMVYKQVFTLTRPVCILQFT